MRNSSMSGQWIFTWSEPKALAWIVLGGGGWVYFQLVFSQRSAEPRRIIGGCRFWVDLGFPYRSLILMTGNRIFRSLESWLEMSMQNVVDRSVLWKRLKMKSYALRNLETWRVCLGFSSCDCVFCGNGYRRRRNQGSREAGTASRLRLRWRVVWLLGEFLPMVGT